MPNSKIIRTTPEAQGDSEWIAPVGTLGELVAKAVVRSRALKLPADRVQIARSRASVIRLSSALRTDFVGIIAEIKRSSPSKGDISPMMDSGEQARRYQAGGAAAISVLTEPEKFGGSDDDIVRATSVSTIPILKKDFHVTESQLVNAAQLGVSAALVIVRSVEPVRLRALAAVANDLDLEIVYEVRNERELELALNLAATVVGVNNRDLETLEIDRDTVARVVPSIPPECLAIAESGYSSPESVADAAAAGADAVLIGSSLSASQDPETAVRKIAGVRRQSRHG